MILLEIAEQLDGMEQDVTTWEAAFLDTVLQTLREGRQLSPKQIEKLKEVFVNYFPEEGKYLAEEENGGRH